VRLLQTIGPQAWRQVHAQSACHNGFLARDAMPKMNEIPGALVLVTQPSALSSGGCLRFSNS